MTEPHLAAPLAAALAAKGYDSLTPVQEAVLTPATAGRDMLVSARTGSGKTVAFGLAIAPEVLGGAEKLLPAEAPLALAIAPTRELALQVARELSWLYGEAEARIATCVGGMDYRSERRALQRGAHVVVGTPGRLRDHIERGSLVLSDLRACVLDEADEMLDLGFREDLEFILAAAPGDRRTLMFSATVPRGIADLAATFQKDSLRIETAGEARQHADIAYHALGVAAGDRDGAIFNLLRFHDAPAAIVFCKTRANVNHLLARMSNRGFQVVGLSGELSQAERTHALQALRDGRARVCVATDVAARGIDLPGLDLVVHADLPTNPETLLHRSGRTGRAGAKGISALIVAPADVRKARRLLAGAKVVAEWGAAPSAEAVQARDDARVLDHPALAEAPEDEAELAATLLGRFGPERVAAAFIRLWRGQRSAPEEIAAPAEAEAPAPRRPRGDFGESVWFSLPIGRSGGAEPRWLLPRICEAGGITREAIGAIRIGEDESFVQIATARASGLPDGLELDRGLILRRLDGEPAPERFRTPARRAERRPKFDPAREPEAAESPRPAKPRGKPGAKAAAPGPAGKARKAPAKPRGGKPERPAGKKGKPRPPRGS
ncbi:DEAD/DEAH box helicase [Amaricoccus solimangrovi]|uniref:DEAD/DEAH box helicase n=1 Tax=Amaricoccus solimangrovi TaxID=2589815 RepID=A0A501WSC7_9RHOB|nr:DEAD/DEAH box helicase [Amaricoccus solimangrovi]TPE50994.1 DEAD/DEAH box helicase [Amaricoccus solimangrovi]